MFEGRDKKKELSTATKQTDVFMIILQPLHTVWSNIF